MGEHGTLNQVYFSPLSHLCVPQSRRHPARESKDIGGWIKRCTLVSLRTRNHKHKKLNNSGQGVTQPSAILVTVELTGCLFFSTLPGTTPECRTNTPLPRAVQKVPTQTKRSLLFRIKGQKRSSEPSDQTAQAGVAHIRW